MTPASRVKAVMIHTISGEWKAAMPAFFVEKPPVAMVDTAWQKLSNQPMPARRRHRVSRHDSER